MFANHKTFISATIIYLIIIKALVGQPMERNLAELIPNEIKDWIVEGKDQVLGPHNLHEYINGGAELFLSYGYHKLFSRIYTSSNQPDIIVDVFDMATSQNAYGVFSYSREKEDTTFGQGSQYVPGLLLFWKDRFYVSLLFTPETEKAKQTAFQIARHIESSIKSEGPLPDILNLLPQTLLVKESIRYFRHHIWLNSYHFISNENILHIDNKTEVILAKYGERELRQILLLLIYPNKSDAKTARNDFAASYLPMLLKTPYVKRNGKWVGCKLSENVLIVVFDAPRKESVQKLIEKIQKNLHKK